MFSTDGQAASATELELDAHQTALLLTGDLSRYRGLIALDLTVERDLQAAVLKVCAGLPALRQLRIRGSRLRIGTLPHQISDLTNLTELTLVGCALPTLPPTFAELSNLRQLTLSGHHFTTFPMELTTLTGLVELRLVNAGRYTDLPPELARLTALRVLDLTGGDFTDLGPITALPELASLTLDRCRGVLDLTGLRRLPLRELGLRSLPGLRSVAPLRAVSTLTSLDLRQSDEIADFHVLLDHPRLTDVLGSDAITRLWAHRAELVGLPDIAELRATLRTADSVHAAEPALVDVCRLATATQGPSTNRLAELFNVDSDGPVVAIGELATVMARFGAELRGSTLIALVRAAYASHTHHLEVTLLALAELVRRGDEAAQTEFIEILEAAHRYYDAGHRGFDGDVYDGLVDDILPGFRPVPLANLLLRFGTYDYLILDGFGRLLGPALAGPLPAPLRTELLGLLRDEATRPGYGQDQWAELLAGLSTEDLPAPVREELAGIRRAQPDAAIATPLTAAPLTATPLTAAPLTAVPLTAVPLTAVPVTAVPVTAVPPEPTVDRRAVVRRRLAAADLGASELLAILADLPDPEPLPDGETDLADPVASAVHNRLVTCLAAGDRTTALALTRAYAGIIDPLGHSERVREAMASMALMCAVANGDEELARVVVGWVPSNINLPNLAFNLACYHACRGGGAPLYDAVRHARRLGKSREQFLADTDFAGVRDDPAFHRALTQVSGGLSEGLSRG